MQRTDTRRNTGEFIILAKFGGHVLHHLASRLVNVIREGGREGEGGRKGGKGGGRQAKDLVFLNPYLSFYNCCTVLCTI